MKFCMLVVSDIHFNIDIDNAFIFNKLKPFSTAVYSAMGRKDNHLIIIVNGDVAYHGKKEEFDFAYSFFISFEEEMMKFNKDMTFSYVFSPGNHDCDFSKYSEAQRKKLSFYASNNKLLDNISEYLIKLDNFYSFAEKFPSLAKTNTFDFFAKHSFTNGGHPIYVIAYNSVIAYDYKYKYDRQIIDSTSIKENIGKLDDGIVLTFSHYPTEWFEREKNDFLEYIEKNSHLIFMGHEHKSRVEKITRGDGKEFDRIGGLSFSTEKQSETSGFGFLQLDSETTANSYQEFIFDGSIYVRKPNKLNSRVKNTFKPTGAFVTIDDAKYKDFLNSGFVLHDELGYKFSNYFTFPVIDLHVQKTDEDDLSNYATLDLFNPYDNDSAIIFRFKNSYGKTTMLKYFFQKFYNEGYIPLYIEIDKKNKTTERFLKAIEESIKHFYGEQYEKVLQNPQKIIILVDQISEFKEIASKIIDIGLERGYKKIIATFDERQCMYSTINWDYSLVDSYEVMKFGHAQKYELIEKWVDAHNKDFDDLQKQHKIHNIKKCMEKADMNSGFISTPELAIIFLDAYENDESENMVMNASRGFFYNYLFNKYIIKTSTCSKVDMPFIRTFIQALAYRNFKHPDKSWKDFCREFIHNNMMEDEEFYKNVAEIKKCMLSLKLIDDDVIGRFDFSSKQFQSFFVASYYKDNMDKLSEEIQSICSEIYDDETRNVILFLVHLTKNISIINKISDMADELFKDNCEVEFNEDIEVINVFISGVGGPVDYGDIKKQNINLSKRLDYIENELAKKTPKQLKKEKSMYEKKILASFSIREVINEILVQMLDRGETEMLVKANLRLALRTITEYIKVFDDYLHQVDSHIDEFDDEDLYQFNDITFEAVINFLSLVLYLSDNLAPLKNNKFLSDYIKQEYNNNAGTMLRSLLDLYASRKRNTPDMFDLLIRFRNKMRAEKNYACVALLNASINREINYIGLSPDKKMRLLEKSEAKELSKHETEPIAYLKQKEENKQKRLGFIKKSRMSKIKKK